jgi:hypothetical protein
MPSADPKPDVLLLRTVGANDGLSAGEGGRIVQSEILPAGKASVDIDKLTYAVP